MPATVTEQNNWIATRTYDYNSLSSGNNSSLPSYYSSSIGLPESTSSPDDDLFDYDYDSSVYGCYMSTLDYGTNEDVPISSIDDNDLFTNEDEPVSSINDNDLFTPEPNLFGYEKKVK